jgi:dTDP-4-dehydrorhamnose 3,5-epimerase
MFDGVLLTPLQIINTPGGDVLHAVKKIDLGFKNFEEAYLSEIQQNQIKAWKRHKKMTLNLIVPSGKVRFVLKNSQKNSDPGFQEVTLSRDNYARLTIPPMVWFGFQGVSKKNGLVLNIADFMHDANEIERKTLSEIKFDWSK